MKGTRLGPVEQGAHGIVCVINLLFEGLNHGFFKKFLVEAKLLNMAHELPHRTSASDLQAIHQCPSPIAGRGIQVWFALLLIMAAIG